MLLGNQTGVDSRRLVVPEQENIAADDDIATYLLKLPYEATEEVRLLISYSAPAEESMPLNSISFPQAVRWSGQVALRGPVSLGEYELSAHASGADRNPHNNRIRLLVSSNLSLRILP